MRAIGLGEFTESDVAVGGIVGVGREGGGLAGGADAAADEARAVRCGESVGLASGDRGAGAVDGIDEGVRAVFPLGDGVRVERVGGDEVGARFEVLAVDGGDGVGAREAEDVVVALLGRGVGDAGAVEVGLLQPEALEHGTHGAVEHEDAGGGERVERV